MIEFAVAVAFLAAFAALAVAVFAANQAVVALKMRQVPLARLDELQLQVTDLQDRQAHLLDSFKRLAGRQKVRDHRADNNGLPDPKTDPEGWRVAMDRLLMQKRHGLQ